ncbi:MAG TPA: RNA polymerase sigma factor [Sphingomicrobium sp.]|nr:RNA polymerase sigma factor [Sphingomicrobium sp.]
MPIGSDNVVDSSSVDGDVRSRVDLLYREHGAALRRRLRARLGSSEEANDLLNEAFARLLGARPLLGVREPRAFLNRIVRNLLIDRVRRQSARPVHVTIDSEHDRAVPPDQEQSIELEQMRSRFRQVIDALPPRMRHVFVLHRLDGLSYKEIAERLDISTRTVEWHIAEAIVRLSRGLDGE